MKIIIKIPDIKKIDIINSFAIQYGYEDEIYKKGKLVKNNISKKDFFFDKISSFIKDVYVASKITSNKKDEISISKKAKEEINNLININYVYEKRRSNKNSQRRERKKD